MPTRYDRVCETVDGDTVQFRRLADRERETPAGLIPWVYLGLVNGSGPEMWKANGRWREDETPHPFDLAIAAQK